MADLGGPRGGIDALLHLAMLQSFSVEGFRSWNGVTWSLGLEWCWYLLFPLAVWVARKRGIGFLLLTAGAITIAYRVGLWLVMRKVLGNYDSGDGLPDVTRNFVLGRLFEFGLGMWVAAMLARGHLPRVWWWVASAMGVGGLIAGRLGERTDVLLPVRDIAYGIAFAGILLITVWPGRAALEQRRASRISLGGLLATPVFKWIGECSYSLYLFHLPLVMAAAIITHNHGIQGVRRFGWMLLALPAAVILARVMYLGVEKPFMSAGRAADGDVKKPLRVSAGASAAGSAQKEELHVAV